MQDKIERIDGLIKELEGISAEERTPFVQIASGRLEAAKGRLQEHIDEMKKRGEEKARIVAAKEKELASLKGAPKADATAPTKAK
jgi:hypothetical protein